MVLRIGKGVVPFAKVGVGDGPVRGGGVGDPKGGIEAGRYVRCLNEYSLALTGFSWVQVDV